MTFWIKIASAVLALLYGVLMIEEFDRGQPIPLCASSQSSAVLIYLNHCDQPKRSRLGPDSYGSGR